MQDSTRVPVEDRQFGDMVVAQGLCSREKVDQCLSFLGRLIAEGVTPVPRLGELLARKGYLSADRVDATVRPSGGGRDTRVEPDLPGEAAAAAGDPANLLGKYVRVSPLGSGGMGEVWRGWDRELRRWVALKFLHHADAAQQARFRREAQTAAALNHPNIASVYEVGEKDGKPFIAMQFIAGQTLATVPRNDLRRIVAFVRDAALAVHYAHERGVVHRDLKPHNLMAEGERVYVMDFGLAKPTTVDSSLSASGQILGTPAYMAPEQARGDSPRVGPRSDVYALGATLYELLADRPPHQETEVYALLKKIVDEDPLPLRKRSPRVPRDLDTIVLKCLEKNPDRRYATAQELADELGRWLGGEAILAHPPSAGYLLRKFLARRKGIVVASSVGVTAVILAVSLLLPRWLGARADADALKELGELRTQMLVVREWMRQSFRSPREIRDAFERENARLTDFIARHPDRPQGLYSRAQGRLFLGMLKAAEEDLREAIRREPRFDPAWTLLGRVLLERYMTRLYGDPTGDQQRIIDAARPLLQEAREALGRGAAKGSEKAIDAWGLSRTPEDAVQDALAQAFLERYVTGELQAAVARLKEAQAKLPSEQYCRWLYLWVDDPKEKESWIEQAFRIAPHFAAAYADRCFIRYQTSDVKGAVEDSTRALELNPSLAVAYSTRAACRVLTKEWAACIEDATRAIELDPLLAIAYVNRSAGRLYTADWPGTIRDCDQAIKLDPMMATPYANRAGALLSLGRWPEAIRDCDQALALQPKLVIGFANRGAAKLNLGDLEGSLKDCERALELDPACVIAMVNRGAVLVQQEKVEEGLAALNRAIELDPNFALAYTTRAGIHLARNAPQEALRDCELALKIDPKLAIAYSNRGAAKLDLGEFEPAAADIARAIELGLRVPQTYVGLALARHGLKDLDGAIAALEKALLAAPEGWTYRGEVQKMLDRYRGERRGK